MRFRINTTGTEEDYLAFNYFHSLESTQGKKQVLKARIQFLLFTPAFPILLFLAVGFTSFSVRYAIYTGVYMLVYMLLFKKIARVRIRAGIRRSKKAGKLRFDPVAVFEFYEDNFVEITAATRTEQSFAAIEKICILQGRYVYMYNSSTSAYILPIAQIREQVNPDDFFHFLLSKCSTVEVY